MSTALKFTQSPWQRRSIMNFLRMSRPYMFTAVAEIDITEILNKINECQRQLKMAISLHGVMIYYLAQAAIQHPQTLSYRYGGQMVSFEDADIASTMLRLCPDGKRRLMLYIFRAAQNQSLAQIQWQLRQALRIPAAENPVMPGFFGGLYRRFWCWRMSHNPFLFKTHMGNLGITNLQSVSPNIKFNFFAPNPYTLCIGIGGVSDQVRLDSKGKPEVRKILSVNVNADHAVLDGYPVAEFALTISKMLSEDSFDDNFVREMQAIKDKDG